MDLLDLPEHILIKICDYSTFSDLKEMITTCQYFNELICNTKKLMAKFHFQWRPDREMTRLYKSISMSTFCVNLKYQDELTFDTSVAHLLIDQPCLKHLNLCSDVTSSFFSDDIAEFSGIALESLRMTLHTLTGNEASNINTFLKMQAESLKSLTVIVERSNCHKTVATLLEDVTIEDIRFEYRGVNFTNRFTLGSLSKVTHLVLRSSEYRLNEDVIGLSRFKSVRELTLSEMSITQALLDVLKDLPKLRKINFIETLLLAYDTLPNVIEMTFHNKKFKYLTNLLRVNRQVVKLEVSGEEFVHAGYLMIILRKYKNVKHIDFSEIKMDWHMNDMCSDTVKLYGGDLKTLLLPRYVLKKYCWMVLPETEYKLMNLMCHQELANL